MAEETHGTSPLLRFALLADYPEHMDRVGPLHEAEWGRFAHVFGRKTPEDRVKEWIRNAEEFKAGKRKLDVIFAALDGEKLVGTVAADSNDMPGQSYTPWLASLYIVPEYRGRGLMKALMQHCIDYIASVNDYEALYLWPEKKHLEDIYGRYGWETIKRVDFADMKDIPIMRFTLKK